MMNIFLYLAFNRTLIFPISIFSIIVQLAFSNFFLLLFSTSIYDNFVHVNANIRNICTDIT